PLTEYNFSTHTSNNISGMMIVYNPLNSLLASYSFVDSGGNAILNTALPFTTNAYSVEVELCCVSTSVPEPSSMGFGCIGLGLSGGVYRKRHLQREQGSAAT
ncbi:MAG: PEP-CTERM sorting domain-containing protein, partial [Planctomyces sp.]